MKICHVTSAHERYDTRIFHKECKSLANNGWDVYLLVNDKDADCCIDNVNIVSTEFEPKTRYERMVLSRKYIKRKCLEIDADIYHLHDPELFAIIGFLKRHGKKVIFDSHEDYVSTIKDKGWIPSKLRKIVSAAFGRYEKKIISKVDGAVVCYHWTRDRYQEYLPEKKFQ